jgi:acyl-coenzyme A synthetase/AMP-(fatty) acid ligase/thioesterase domain-containing protein
VPGCLADPVAPALARPGAGCAPDSECDPGLLWLPASPRPLDYNGPVERPFTAPQDPGLPIIQQLERVARRQPAAIALSDADTQLTYTQLWDGICALGETLAAATGPGELVAVRLPPGVRAPLTWLACLAAGRPFLALDSQQPDAWVSQILRDAAPALIVVDSSSLTAGAARTLPLAELGHASKGWRPACLDLDEPACVLFTSGSTGRPRGIVNSQRALLARVIPSIQAAHINACDHLLTLAPPATIVAVRDVLTALLAGSRIHLADPQRCGVRQVREILRAQAITILFAFPALLRLIVPDDGERADAALRLVRVGGDTTLWSDVDRLRAWLAPAAQIQQIYAATEAPVTQWFVDSGCRGEDPRLPLGEPLPGTHLALIDEAGCSVPPGEPGELVVAGCAVALGTWQQGRAVPGYAARGVPGGRMFRTGDLVRQRPGGLLERLGRRDRQVKIRGMRVDPEGVEAALRQHPGVRDAGVVSRAGSPGEMILVACVSAHSAAPAGLLAELPVLMGALPAAMRPARLHQVDEIPRLPGSKLDVRALTALVERLERALPPEATPCTDQIARTVAQVWQEVLQAAPRTAAEDFFAAGGNSLQALRFVSRLERELRRELSVGLLGEAPTFARLCEVLRRPRAAHGGSLLLLKPGDGSPPLYLVHGVAGQAAELLMAARSIRYPGAVFGLQARGLRERERPHTTVEAMAADYLAQIKALRPAGPCHLCGYSAGGLVAFEMACQLRAAGEIIGLVGLLDTLPRPRWRPGAWLERLHRRCSARQGLHARVSLQAATLTAMLRRLSLRSLKVAAAGLVAALRYRPGYYAGKLTLFTPAGRDPALPDLLSLWARHAHRLEQVTLPGTHLTMLSRAHAPQAAAALSRQLALCTPLSPPHPHKAI